MSLPVAGLPLNGDECRHLNQVPATSPEELAPAPERPVVATLPQDSCVLGPSAVKPRTSFRLSLHGGAEGGSDEPPPPSDLDLGDLRQRLETARAMKQHAPDGSKNN